MTTWNGFGISTDSHAQGMVHGWPLVIMSRQDQPLGFSSQRRSSQEHQEDFTQSFPKRFKSYQPDKSRKRTSRVSNKEVEGAVQAGTAEYVMLGELVDSDIQRRTVYIKYKCS